MPTNISKKEPAANDKSAELDDAALGQVVGGGLASIPVGNLTKPLLQNDGSWGAALTVKQPNP